MVWALFGLLFLCYGALLALYLRTLRHGRRDQMALAPGKGGILITIGKDGPEGIDFRDRPAARVVADCLLAANSLSMEIEGAIAKAAGAAVEQAPNLADEARMVGDLLMLARNLTLSIEAATARRARLVPVAPEPVAERVVG